MKKIVLIIICIIICFSFVFFNIDLTAVDILMRPPKLSGENRLLQQTFEATVGDGESVLMKTPVSGENRSSYLLVDLDNDSTLEALVLYSNPVKDELVYVSVFKFLNNEWLFVSKIEGRSEEIYAIDFSDINGDGSLEVLISWSLTNSNSYISMPSLVGNGDRLLTIYAYNGTSTKLLKNETYTKLLIEDINNDNADELFIINISLSNQVKVSFGRIISFSNDYSVNQDIKFNLTGMLDVQNIVCDSYLINGEAHSRVYVDALISESGIITEVIDVQHNDFSVELPFYESNVSAQPQTLRDVRIYSQDFDNDGVVEVPTIEKLNCGVKVSSSSENASLNLTVWHEIFENQLTVDTKCLWNGMYGYMIVYPAEWVEMYATIYKEESATVTFYSLDENSNPLKPLFSIKAIFEPKWKENDYGYTKFDENGVYIFGYSILDEENEVQYIRFIEENFELINQE